MSEELSFGNCLNPVKSNTGIYILMMIVLIPTITGFGGYYLSNQVDGTLFTEDDIINAFDEGYTNATNDLADNITEAYEDGYAQGISENVVSQSNLTFIWNEDMPVYEYAFTDTLDTVMIEYDSSTTYKTVNKGESLRFKIEKPTTSVDGFYYLDKVHLKIKPVNTPSLDVYLVVDNQFETNNFKSSYINVYTGEGWYYADIDAYLLKDLNYSIVIICDNENFDVLTTTNGVDSYTNSSNINADNILAMIPCNTYFDKLSTKFEYIETDTVTTEQDYIDYNSIISMSIGFSSGIFDAQTFTVDIIGNTYSFLSTEGINQEVSILTDGSLILTAINERISVETTQFGYIGYNTTYGELHENWEFLELKPNSNMVIEFVSLYVYYDTNLHEDVLIYKISIDGNIMFLVDL